MSPGIDAEKVLEQVPSRPRWRVNGQALRRARARLGMTQRELGAECGWTASYVWRLENQSYVRVGREAAEKLRCALNLENEPTQ